MITRLSPFLDTVLTCFPSSYPEPSTSAGVHLEPGQQDIIASLLKHFRDPNKRRWIRSARDLATCIADRCASNFFDQQLHCNEKFDFLGMFQHSLAGVVSTLSLSLSLLMLSLMSRYHAQMDEQSRLYENKSRAVRNDDRVDSDNQVEQVELKAGPEFRLLEEAKDILDELHIMRDVNVEQNTLLKTLYSILHGGSEPEGQVPAGFLPARVQMRAPSRAQGPPRVDPKTKITRYFLHEKPGQRAQLVGETVHKAEAAYEAILRLIDAKQRQANLFQARSIKTLLAFNNRIMDQTRTLTESNQAILQSAKRTMQESEKSGETLMVVSFPDSLGGYKTKRKKILCLTCGISSSP